MQSSESGSLQLYVDAQGQLVQVYGPLTDTVEFCPQGGGFPYKVSKAEFLARFKPCDPPTFGPIQVTGDWLPDGMVLDAFGNGLRWNGWAMPHFTYEEALKLLEPCGNIRYDEAEDAFIATIEGYPEGEDEEVFKSVTLDVDGQPVKTYPIGARSWCWEFV